MYVRNTEQRPNGSVSLTCMIHQMCVKFCQHWHSGSGADVCTRVIVAWRKQLIIVFPGSPLGLLLYFLNLLMDGRTDEKR